MAQRACLPHPVFPIEPFDKHARPDIVRAAAVVATHLDWEGLDPDSLTYPRAYPKDLLHVFMGSTPATAPTSGPATATTSATASGGSSGSGGGGGGDSVGDGGGKAISVLQGRVETLIDRAEGDALLCVADLTPTLGDDSTRDPTHPTRLHATRLHAIRKDQHRRPPAASQAAQAAQAIQAAQSAQAAHAARNLPPSPVLLALGSPLRRRAVALIGWTFLLRILSHLRSGRLRSALFASLGACLFGTSLGLV